MPSPNDLNGLLSGLQWGTLGQPVSLTYRFPTGAAEYPSAHDYDHLYGGSGELRRTVAPFNSAQQAAALDAILAWSNVANISLSAAPFGEGNLRFMFSAVFSPPAGGTFTVGHTYYPDQPLAGDSWYNYHIKDTYFADVAPGSDADLR
jgi:hypothetical protein